VEDGIEMLSVYALRNGQLSPVDLGPQAQAEGRESAVWFDLLDPTQDEDRLVEQLVGISIPTRGEVEEIELSSRLYHEGGAEFMTITAVTQLDTEDPVKTPVTFILSGEKLITVRYAELRSFSSYTTRAQRAGSPCSTGEQVMFGLLESLIDRLADALERVGDEIDSISREVFRQKAGTASKRTRNLEQVIQRVGRTGSLLSVIGEGLVSMLRLLTYHAATDTIGKSNREARQKAKVLQRDVSSLSDHTAQLSGKVDFLLDATLGLINLEQNAIIKIFSVAAVVFLPPTLVASIYGMNFNRMPELQWLLGYPWALGLMVASAVLPFLYFKKRGWL
jgi:magnesium transporter